MKKIIYILFVALVGIVSCTVNDPEVSVPGQEDGKVTFMMKVTFPEVLVNTKSTDMAITPNVDNIYVAVFGNNHYLNEYVKAVPCDANGIKKTGYGDNEDGVLANDTDFWFKVTLSATTSKRYVHVFANGQPSMDFDYEENIMKQLTTEDPAGSYWTYIVLPNGTAQIRADGTPTTLPSAEALFQDLRLIRNFARIKLDVADGVNFTPTGFQVYNTPTHGSVAVWRDDLIDNTDVRPAATGFFKEYYEKDMTWLLQNYDPCVPDDEIKADVPSVDDDFDMEDKFVFERADASTNRPYIIMKGIYGSDPDEPETFYRLELVDPDGNYLPLLRNQEYYIHLSAVAKRGVSDPTQAKASNANVSSVASAELSDLSNGISRIYVQWVDQAYMEAGEQTFKYKYLPDATENTPQKAVLSIESGAGQAISGTTVAAAFTQSENPDNQGWYTVTFNTTSPGEAEKITKFRVTGIHEDQKLYRDITVHVIPWLQWGTTAEPSANISVSTSGGAVGATVDVTITLKTGLPSSIFPLEISFEDSQKYLDPVGTSMPAVLGKSIVTGKTNENSYQFVKTVSFLDYSAAGGNVITANFKRVKTGNTTTTLYIKNKYFQTVGSVTIPNN